jgi:hypothetical protein
MKRSFHCLISTTLILSITLGCSIFNIPIGTPVPHQETINTIIQVAQTVTAEQADQAELDMVKLIREQSGARAAFGDQADAIFLQIDQDKAAALDEMVNKARGAVNNPLKVSALLVKPGTSGTTSASPLRKNNYITQSMVQAFMMIGLTTMFSNPNNETAIGDISEGGDPVGTPGTHYSFQPLFFGSRLEATGTITNTVTSPFPYQETIQYDLSMEACPDAQGDVPIHLTIQSSASLLGGGVQMSLDNQVTGHTNDEGVLASTNYDTTYEGSRQPIHGVGENLGTVNTSFAYHENITLNTDPGVPATGTEGYTRVSADTDRQFYESVIQEMRFISFFLSFQALDAAQKKWTTGYCVEIQVPGQGDGVKTVQPNSDTPFTATVRHKFEEVELQVPVIATLSDGQVSVNPSGSKVQAPASFSYKAPGENDKSATVNLVTRSKRGVATLDIKFKTGGQGWKVDQPVPGLTGNFTGLSCSSPYGPWEITYEGPDSMGMNRVGIFHVPLFEDGKSIATLEESGSTDYSGYNVVSTVDATIAPDANGYLIDFKSQTMTGTMWVTGAGSRTINLTTPGYKISVLPADPGQCTQP